jgi:hypothetical protein
MAQGIQRHVLKISLVRARLPRLKVRFRYIVGGIVVVVIFRHVAGVVVLDLVVVPSNDEREPRVGSLEVCVALVLRVAVSVVVEGHDLRHRYVLPYAGGRSAVFVDVVAEVYNEVDLLLCQMLPCCVEALLEMLARDERETEPPGVTTRLRERARSPNGTDVPVRLKVVPIPAIGCEPAHTHVNRMPVLG